MASKKQATTMQTWDQVDAGLRRMGEIDVAVAEIEGELTLKVNELKAAADVKAEGLKTERKALEADITAFCEGRKEEFTKVRSRELTFGVVAYRVTSRIMIRSKAACLAALHALRLDSYIRTIEEPDKEAMDGLDDMTLAKVGASRKVEDKLRIEPRLEALKEAA